MGFCYRGSYHQLTTVLKWALSWGIHRTTITRDFLPCRRRVRGFNSGASWSQIHSCSLWGLPQNTWSPWGRCMCSTETASSQSEQVICPYLSVHQFNFLDTDALHKSCKTWQKLEIWRPPTAISSPTVASVILYNGLAHSLDYSIFARDSMLAQICGLVGLAVVDPL